MRMQNASSRSQNQRSWRWWNWEAPRLGSTWHASAICKQTLYSQITTNNLSRWYFVSSQLMQTTRVSMIIRSTTPSRPALTRWRTMPACWIYIMIWRSRRKLLLDEELRVRFVCRDVKAMRAAVVTRIPKPTNEVVVTMDNVVSDDQTVGTYQCLSKLSND